MLSRSMFFLMEKRRSDASGIENKKKVKEIYNKDFSDTLKNVWRGPNGSACQNVQSKVREKTFVASVDFDNADEANLLDHKEENFYAPLQRKDDETTVYLKDYYNPVENYQEEPFSFKVITLFFQPKEGKI